MCESWAHFRLLFDVIQQAFYSPLITHKDDNFAKTEFSS